MTRGGPWFLGFLLSDPACRGYLAAAGAGFLVFTVAASALLAACGRYSEDLRGLESLAAPYRTLRYSLHGELRAWDGYLEFLRGGTCIGQVHAGVTGLSWAGGKDDRVLSLEYHDGSHARFSCGPVGWQEALKIKTLVMRCAGRHAYG